MPVTDLVERLRLEVPVVQAGMGGGLATAALAAAVSGAGALGTVGLLPEPRAFAAELRRARRLAPRRPLAANLLVPLARPAHVDACIATGVDVVSTFCGTAPRSVARLRAAGILVLAQVGTVAEAHRAIAAGGRPVLAAGGIASGASARAALDAGAAAVWCGTRFLLTEECGAHPGYKERVLGSPRTLDTLLFSVGWSDRHRVVPNAATDRWCARDERGPRAVTALNRVLAPALGRLPPRIANGTAHRQRVGVPLFGPAPVLAGMDERLLDVSPLYAGRCAREITSVVPAADAVRELAPATGAA